MPQWRKLHTKAIDSQDIHDMPGDFVRLLWILLPLGLDREGRGIDNPGWVRAKIMPLREDVTNEMVSDALDWLANRKNGDDRGMINRYESDGRKCFYVPTWHIYQTGTDREAESVLPPPPNSRVSQDQLASKSCSDADADADADAIGGKPPRKKSERDIVLSALEKFFSEETELPLPPRGNKKDSESSATGWWNPLWSLYELTNKDIEATKLLIKAAVSKLCNSDFTISSPRSIEKVARSEWARGKRNSRQTVQSEKVYR